MSTLTPSQASGDPALRARLRVDARRHRHHPGLAKELAPYGITVNAVSDVPLGRPQDSDDIGEAIAFLASDRARTITGEGLNLSAGATT